MSKITSYVLEQEELEKDFPQNIEQDLLCDDPAYQDMELTETNNEPLPECF